MIKSHFRLKLGEGVLYPEVEQVLNEDVEQQVENLAKRIYKTSKQTLVDQLLRRSRRFRSMSTRSLRCSTTASSMTRD